TLVSTHSTSTAPGDAPPDSDWIEVGGQVVSSTGPAVGGALVELIELGLRTTAGDDGRYSLLRVPAGNHTRRTVAIGFKPDIKPNLAVPGRPEDYDVILTPL